ncbi:PREDICTED: (S)-N-methylcoclaurine 3'-hydroxylase isozyme 1-like [Ipomoea nil]|uniref:(S)-N-methylcoclaurine 3'-hydroxylase isozyme 1-like n=1 Tax=Ipomoea nil TaxID=35883 RepID=UPI0009017585|nr:PREDICTED: (S)-N-methylcoclaurine 3'-hydroxylase isozyme 1-like [Ipomoea nil]
MVTMAHLNESERPFPLLLHLLPFSIILPLLVLTIIIFKLFLKPSKPLHLPPGPTPWPLLGNIFHLGKKTHITLTTFANTYGPLISLKLGTQHLVVGSSPSVASEILKTHDRLLSGRHVPHAFPTETSQLDHTSIGWTSECHEGWRSLRALCRAEMFCSRALESQALLREKKAGEMVGFLRSKVGSEEGVDVGEMVFATVLNMLSNVMLSRDVIRFEGDGVMKGLIRSVMEVASAPNLSDFYPFLQRLDPQGLRKRALGLGMRIRSMWEPIIEERREVRCSSGGSSHQDFLDTLLDKGFSNERIHQLFMELFAAGTDTSTSTIEWAMAELIKSPESMEKVYKELKREINGGDIRESHLVHLPYLQACVKETLRLHPPAPLLLPHRAIEVCQVMNYTIPKDAQILINVWAVQRDASIWDEPLKFRPERFLETGLEFKGNDFEFLPFGAGRRICPGLPMAAKTVPLVLASMIHSFDWSLPDGKNPKDLNMNEKFGVTLQKEQPLFLIPKTRKNM